MEIIEINNELGEVNITATKTVCNCINFKAKNICWWWYGWDIYGCVIMDLHENKIKIYKTTI